MTSTNSEARVYAGAENHGLYRLSPGSDQWESLTNGLPERVEVQGIALHPDNPALVYAGTNDGPYRSSDRGDHWERLDYPQGARGFLAEAQRGHGLQRMPDGLPHPGYRPGGGPQLPG